MPPSKILGVGTIEELTKHLGSEKGVESTKVDSVIEVSQKLAALQLELEISGGNGEPKK